MRGRGLLVLLLLLAAAFATSAILWWSIDPLAALLTVAPLVVVALLLPPSESSRPAEVPEPGTRRFRRDSTLMSLQQHRISQAQTEVSIDYYLQRSVFQVSTELVDCLEEGQVAERFGRAIARYWANDGVELLLWERGRWRRAGDLADKPEAVTAPELDQAVVMPTSGQDDLLIDLSPAVAGQAVLVVHGARRQPSLMTPVAVNQRSLVDVLRGQLALALRRVTLYTDLQRLGRVDPLTGTWRRWYGQERLAEMINDGRLVSVAMVDIDHFKGVNDQFGHAAGDRVLRAVGDQINRSIRTGDIAYRYGGEEFVILLPGTSPAGAGMVGERLRQAIARLEDLPRPVTVSIGIATGHRDETGEALVARADTALYQAKDDGRDRVVNSDIDTPVAELRRPPPPLERPDTTGSIPRLVGREQTDPSLTDAPGDDHPAP